MPTAEHKGGKPWLKRAIQAGTSMAVAFTLARSTQPPEAPQVVNPRAGHTQKYQPDFPTSDERDHQRAKVDVTFRGQRLTSMPSGEFRLGQGVDRPTAPPVLFREMRREAQGAASTKHKARQREGWQARAGSAARAKRVEDARRFTAAKPARLPQRPVTAPDVLMGVAAVASVVGNSEKSSRTKGIVRTGLALGALGGLFACGPGPETPSAITELPPPGITIESPPTATVEAPTPPAGPNDPGVLEEARSSAPPTFEEVMAAGPAAFRVVSAEEYRGWLGAGVQAQVDAVKARVPPGTKILVVQSGDQWGVVAISDKGFYLPADAQGNLLTTPYFRTDWVSSTSQYVLVEDGLEDVFGAGVERGAIQINSHWRLVAVKDGQVAAMVEVAADGSYKLRYNEVVTLQKKLKGTGYELVWQAGQGRLTYTPEAGPSIGLPGTVDADGSLHITLPDGKNVVAPLAEGEALSQYRDGPAILDTEAVPAYMLNAEKTAWVEVPLPEIWTDPARPEKYPIIAWEDITSGLYAKALRQAYEQGTIPPFPPQAFMVDLEPPSEDLTRSVGFDGPSFNTRAEGYGKYLTDPTTRPLRCVGYGITEIKGGKLVVSARAVLNKDRSVMFLIDLTSDVVIGDPYLWSNFLTIVGPNSSVNVLPIIQYKDKDTCTRVLYETYCDWFWPKQEEIMQLTNEWIATGNAPKAMERLPFFGISTSW